MEFMKGRVVHVEFSSSSKMSAVRKHCFSLDHDHTSICKPCIANHYKCIPCQHTGVVTVIESLKGPIPKELLAAT